MKWKPFACLALLLAGIIGWIVIYTDDHRILGGLNQATASTSWEKAVLGYVMVAIGILLGTGFRAAKDVKQKGMTIIDNFQQFTSQIVRSTDLWMGFFAAPILAGIVVTTATDVTDFGFVLIALQNGFFCQGVIERLQAPHNAPNDQ